MLLHSPRVETLKQFWPDSVMPVFSSAVKSKKYSDIPDWEFFFFEVHLLESFNPWRVVVQKQFQIKFHLLSAKQVKLVRNHTSMNKRWRLPQQNNTRFLKREKQLQRKIHHFSICLLTTSPATIATPRVQITERQENLSNGANSFSQGRVLNAADLKTLKGFMREPHWASRQSFQSSLKTHSVDAIR